MEYSAYDYHPLLSNIHDILTISFVELLCVMPISNAPASVSEPSGEVPLGFNMNLIAVIVCAPAAAGAAIFLGIFFGRRNAKKKGQKSNHDNSKDDLPLAPLDYGKVRALVQSNSASDIVISILRFNELTTTNTVPWPRMCQTMRWSALIECTFHIPTSNS